MNEPRQTRDLFEIHAPGVDTGEVLRGVEERVQERSYDPREIERLERLSFAPVSPAREHGFDPALTTELFERPVDAPDFASRKYRALGPLRGIARHIYRQALRIFQKLSEHRVQAFYNVVHELIGVNYRQERLRERLDALEEENLLLRDRLALAEANGRRNLNVDADAPGAAPRRPREQGPAPQAPPTLEERNRALRDRLTEISGPVLLLDDDGALAYLVARESGAQVICNAGSAAEEELLAGSGALVVRSSAGALLARQADGGVGAVLLADAGRFRGRLEQIPALAARKLTPAGLLWLRFYTGVHDSPFVRVQNYACDSAELRRYCEDLGFESEAEERPAELREGSFELLVRRTAGDA